MLADQLTPEAVASLWSAMATRHKASIYFKDQARSMRFVADFLGAVHIMDPEEFLSRYTMTIGDRIFINFMIGDSGSGRDLLGQVRTCGHEFRHVAQYREDGAQFVLGYLLDSAARARYEMEAYQVSMEIHYRLTGRVPSPRHYAELLRAYKCSEADIDFVEVGLKAAETTLLAGGSVRREAREVLELLQALAGGDGVLAPS